MTTTINGTDIHKVVVACDAGMGSSVMLASQLRRQLGKNAVTVEHTPVAAIPADAEASPLPDPDTVLDGVYAVSSQE